MDGEITRLYKIRKENIAAIERANASVQALKDENAQLKHERAYYLNMYNAAALEGTSTRHQLNASLELLREANEELEAAFRSIMELRMVEEQSVVGEVVDKTNPMEVVAKTERDVVIVDD